MLQEAPTLRLIGRNALLLFIGAPIYTGVTLFLMAAVLVISLILVVPVVLLTPALLAVWATCATGALIAAARRRREEAGTRAAGPPLPRNTAIAIKGMCAQVGGRGKGWESCPLPGMFFIAQHLVPSGRG
ncbi:MAG: hypothetical protein ACUVS4_09770 [Chloroflexaceae bacterium]